MEISVLPTLATELSPKPRKMSPMPQMAKLTTSTPMTTAMTTCRARSEEAL